MRPRCDHIATTDGSWSAAKVAGMSKELLSIVASTRMSPVSTSSEEQDSLSQVSARRSNEGHGAHTVVEIGNGK